MLMSCDQVCDWLIKFNIISHASLLSLCRFPYKEPHSLTWTSITAISETSVNLDVIFSSVWSQKQFHFNFTKRWIKFTNLKIYFFKNINSVAGIIFESWFFKRKFDAVASFTVATEDLSRSLQLPIREGLKAEATVIGWAGQPIKTKRRRGLLLQQHELRLTLCQ